jgi:hypothetical protein
MSQLSTEKVRRFAPDNLKVPLQMFPSAMDRHANPINKEVYDEGVRDYISYGHGHLVGRQVPSCLALTKLGTRIAPRDVEALLNMGFHMKKCSTDGNSWKEVPIRESTRSAISETQMTYFSALMKSVDRSNETFLPDIIEEDGVPSELPDILGGHGEEEEEEPHKGYYRFVYEDPFKINAAAQMSDLIGQCPMKIVCWPGGVKRLQDNIPAQCLYDTEAGRNLKRGMPFYKIQSTDIKLYVLLRHTHWGRHLTAMCKPSEENPLSNWAQLLRKRITFFLEGRHDPFWSKDQIEIAYGARDYQTRKPKERALRFLQILETVDGLFVQTYLSDLTAGWSWQLFDNYVLGAIHHLIGDEFLDGDLPKEFLGEDVITVYERLKTYRGQLKEAFLQGKPLPEGTGINRVLGGAVQVLNGLPEGLYRSQVGAILTQTRGCGTPPPLVVLKAKMKFIQTVSSVPDPLKTGQASLVRLSLQQIVDEIPDHVFTGLQTKAGVNVTTSACIEELRADGGSSEYIRQIVREGTLGRKVKIIDLNTGQTQSLQELEEISVGGYIFWRCLEEVLATEPVVLREAQLVMVREPGKARTVTKAHAALKVILDLVSGICSYPLKKGVESSHSGMAAANHGWNFFTNLYSLWKELTFNVVSTEKGRSGPDSFLERIEYADLYVGFTDYSEATDKMDHKLAQIAAETWMLKCGIPIILRGIVHETCYKPRTILFNGTGPLERFGEPTDIENVRKVTLVKGVLMGDPLTKVVLHLLNIVSRRLGMLTTERSVTNMLPGVGGLIAHRLTDYLSARN